MLHGVIAAMLRRLTFISLARGRYFFRVKEAAAFYEKGNNAAGTRLRNVMLQLKVAATDIRKEVTEKKNTK